MKKFFAAVLTGIMLLSIAGCGKTGIENAGDSWVSDDEDVDVYEYDDGTKLYEGTYSIQFGMMGDKILLIETQFFDELKLSGYFILLPDMDGYSKILSSLGMGDVQL